MREPMPFILLVVIFAALLIAICGLSVMLGPRTIAPADIVAAFRANDGGADHTTVLSLRVPRTVIGVMAGMALGISGALLQAMTRNPLADTGVLGINAGAAFAMVLGIAFFGVTSASGLVWFSFIGTGVTALGVYSIAASGKFGATPLRLILAGVALGALIRGLTAALVLTNPVIFDQMLSWDVGTLALIGGGRITVVLPFILIGLILAASLAPALQILSLGDQSAKALGASLIRIRALTLLAVILLTGAATAACGPIGFLGLMVPQMARAICGAHQPRIMALTVLIAPAILLGADLMGRMVMRPGDIDVGIVMAILGAPMLIYVVMRRKVAAL